MELKWLEDFIALAQVGNFSEAAKLRFITQSAFSRRIQALEKSLNTMLFDRSVFPIKLTPAGREFREAAEEVVRILDRSRANLNLDSRTYKHNISISTVHTLSLTYFPQWFRSINEKIGPLNSRLMVDDFIKCVDAMADGRYDFLLTFYHESVPIILDPTIYPYCIVGIDSIIAVKSSKKIYNTKFTPLLTYPKNSFLGRVSASSTAILEKTKDYTVHINENAMALSMKTMVLEGYGAAWLPRSIVEEELSDGRLAALGCEIPLEIRLYCNLERRRPIVSEAWNKAKTMGTRVIL